MDRRRQSRIKRSVWKWSLVASAVIWGLISLFYAQVNGDYQGAAMGFIVVFPLFGGVIGAMVLAHIRVFKLVK
ncbi:MAG: hypothetical protein M1358_22175 [Chloroflexi bacterium]|nr:hypothetical protein [Chloroflexota bacterium]